MVIQAERESVWNKLKGEYMKRKVYLVIFESRWDEIFYVESIYSTKEKAEMRIQQLLDNMTDTRREEYKDYYFVEDFVVD